jgi:hypothetical protein
MPSLSVFFRVRDVVIHATHETTAGFLFGGPPAARVDRAGLETALVPAVRAVLLGSKVGVGVPTRDEARTNLMSVLKTANVRSWTALARNARLCLVASDGNWLTITPTRNGGLAGDERGFHEIADARLRMSADGSDEDLLQALLRAEALCQ